MTRFPRRLGGVLALKTLRTTEGSYTVSVFIGCGRIARRTYVGMDYRLLI